MKLRSASLLVTACLIFLLVACEPGTNLEYVNNSSQRVTVYEGGDQVAVLEPGESDKTVVINQFWTPEIKVVAADGQILLEDNITLDELREMDGKIVIIDLARP